MVILILHALINIYSSHLVALFNNISVFWHCVGVVVIIGILIIVPDNHQSADFVFTERINNSGFSMDMYWYYILPTGLLLTMYTVTGYDASAHVAEETKDAEISAAKGVWQSVALSALIGWFVLLAITFAASDVAAVNDAGGTSLSIFTSAMSEGWAETVILISTIGQFFCGMACVTSCSRTFFAFSRDRATPGWQLWSRVNSKGVPVAAVLGSCLLALIITLPALTGNAAGVPVAFFAVVSIGVISLYLAYVTPVYLRWRKGDDFKQGAWNLGERWRWLNPIAVVWVLVTSIYFCLPFYGPAAVWWDDAFDWNAANFTPLVLGGLAIAIALAWVLGMRNRYTGPVRTIEFDEGMGVKEIDEPPADRRLRRQHPPSEVPRQRPRTSASARARPRAIRRPGWARPGGPPAVVPPPPRASRARPRPRLPGLPRLQRWRRREPASTGTPIASAWSWSSSGSLVRPPSTRRSRTSTASRTAATTSATRQAMPSSAARATFARVVPP